MCQFFMELFEMLPPPPKKTTHGKKFGSRRTRPCSGNWNVMMCKLLNLSTCVLNVCSHKYHQEVDPATPCMAVHHYYHGLCVYDTTLEGWHLSIK